MSMDGFDICVVLCCGCEVSLDARSRMDGVSALDMWDLTVTVLHGNTNLSQQVQGKPGTSPTRQKIPGKIDDLNTVNFVSSNPNSSCQEAMLYIFENNEAVIKMIKKERRPTMRHVSRTHRVALYWLFDRINLDPRSKSNTLTPKTDSQTY